MKLWYIFLGLSFLLVGCGPSEESINATIESGVQLAVAQTVEAIPTQTPYPTLTPIPEPTENPVPDSFKSQLNEFLQATNYVTGATSQGVSLVDLRKLVNEARGAYDLMVAMWPEGLSDRSQTDFEKAFEGWDLSLGLWAMEIGDKDNPVAPNTNRYREFKQYSDLLILETHPDNFIVSEYQGQEYISFENIEILMAIAAEHFDSGQSKTLSLLK